MRKIALPFSELSAAYEYPSRSRDLMRHYRIRGLVEIRSCTLFLLRIWDRYIGFAAQRQVLKKKWCIKYIFFGLVLDESVCFLSHLWTKNKSTLCCTNLAHEILKRVMLNSWPPSSAALNCKAQNVLFKRLPVLKRVSDSISWHWSIRSKNNS